MGRLEDALGRLADQDRHLDPGMVADRLERRLRGGDLPILVPDHGGFTAATSRIPWWRRGPAIALAGAVVALAVAVPLLLVRRSEPAPPVTTTPTTVAPTTVPPTTGPPPTVPSTTVPPTAAITTTSTSTTTTTTPIPPEPFAPLEVTITVEVDGTSQVAAGTFTAAGPAVEAGFVCPSGTTWESGYESTADGREEHWTTVVLCDDGNARIEFDVISFGEWEGGVGGTRWLSTGTWALSDTSEAYAGMMGDGTREGVCEGEDFDCLETITGTVWREGEGITVTTLPPVPGGLEVSFEIDMEIPDPNAGIRTWHGVFAATGAAVDAGLVCAAGDVSVGGFDATLASQRQTVTYRCDDGSGDIDLQFVLTGTYGTDGYTETGTWTVVRGSGGYENLIGGGADDTVMSGNRILTEQRGELALAE